MKISTLAEFVTRARAEPGKFNAAVVPGITEFTFDYFLKTVGLSVQKVPYRDIVQAATDVGEGRLQIYMASYAILQPQAQAGRIKTLAVNGRQTGADPAGDSDRHRGGFPFAGSGGPRRAVRSTQYAQRAARKDRRRRQGGCRRPRNRRQACGHGAGGQSRRARRIRRGGRGQRAKIANIAQALGIKPKQQ
jgi:Uncharacterized protein conserved in bacteria